MNYSSKVLFRKSFERSSRSSRYAKKKAIAKLLDEFAENKLKVTSELIIDLLIVFYSYSYNELMFCFET
jgi:hypothetical protein